MYVVVPDTTRISHTTISIDATPNSKERDENSVPNSMYSSKDEESFYYSEGQFRDCSDWSSDN